MSLTMDHMKRSSYLRRFTVTALITLLMIVMGSNRVMAVETLFTQDYEAEGVTPDWTSSTGGRFTPLIMTEGDNHYLSVNQGERNNNGCTLSSTSLQGMVPAGTDFVMQFDLKLGTSNNQAPFDFHIKDASNSANIFSLIATGAWSTTWYVNSESGNQTVALPGTDSNKDITALTWYTVKIWRVGDKTYVKITNTSTGAVVFERAEVATPSATGGLGKMEIYTKRYLGNFAIDNVVVYPYLRTYTYSKGETTEVYGDLPVGATVMHETEITIPANTSLYKQGYTLTGYNSSIDNVTYPLGSNVAITNDATFTTFFKANNIARTDLAAVVNFDFSDIEWTDNDLEKVYVKQIAFNGESQDVAAIVKNKTLTIDAVPGLTVQFPTGMGSDFSSEGLFTQSGDTWTYNGAAGLVTLTYSGSEEGLSNIAISYPLTQKPVITSNIAVDSCLLKVDDVRSVSITTLNMESGTYQWYSNTIASTEGGTSVANATSSTFTIPTTEAEEGVRYYYCLLTNAQGTATSKILEVTVKANPQIHTDIANLAHALNIGDTQTLSVAAYNMQVTGSTYQWYSNTTQSAEGGTAISGANSATFTVPTASKSSTYYYCVVSNPFGADTSSVAAVHVDDYVTFDFKNWPEEDTEIGNLQQWVDGENGERVYQWAAKGYYTADNWGQKYDLQPILYPYALSGYMGLALGEVGIVNGSGFVQTGRDRPMLVYDLKAGDVIVLTGTGLLEGDIFYPGEQGNATFDTYINSDNTEMTLHVKTDGIFSFMLCAAKSPRVANPVYTLKVPNKYAPTLTQDLDGATYTIARDETKTLTVAATANDANSLSYQWYRNDVDSNKGGRAIDGANSATYTTVEGESYYYYCVVFNSVTGAAVATTKTTHVQCKPQVSYVNDDAAAIGDVPAAEVIEIGEKFTIEARNYQLLKPGYTLTGWTDGANTYEYGQSYDIVNDIVLKPVFRANEQTISAITKVTTVTWPFATSKDAPVVNWTDGETHVLAAQQAVTGESQDFGAKVASTGFATGAANATVAEGTTIKVPIKYGSTIVLSTSGVTPSATVLTTDLVTPRDMTVDGTDLTYVYKGGNDEITITLGAGTYDSLKVHYVPTGMPVFSKNLEEN